MYLNNVKDSTSRSTDLADKLKNGMEGKSDEELMEASGQKRARIIKRL